MASFVLLELTVPERHVSAFCGMFRLGNAKPVTFSISRGVATLRTHYEPSFQRDENYWVNELRTTGPLCSAASGFLQLTREPGIITFAAATFVAERKMSKSDLTEGSSRRKSCLDEIAKPFKFHSRKYRTFQYR